MQLKADGGWFAPNMIHQFPSLSARYSYDDEASGRTGKWDIDVVREPKYQFKTGEVQCEYDWATKELRKIQRQD